MAQDLKRGTLEMILLTLLSEREMYGYEITTAVDQRTGGRLGIGEGTLYPVLYRLEEAGFVAPRWEAEGRGRPRKYYRVTAEGAEELRRLVAEWQTFTGAIASVLKGGSDT